jgi:hypothetical protein
MNGEPFQLFPTKTVETVFLATARLVTTLLKQGANEIDMTLKLIFTGFPLNRISSGRNSFD